MKKLFTLTIMALALMMTNLAWGQTRTTMELTFPLTTNPEGWPTTQSNELTNYVYTLNEVDYTFALKNIPPGGSASPTSTSSPTGRSCRTWA